MPLPQQIINQLSQEADTSVGWSFNVLLFSGIFFGLAVLVYVGMAFIYAPYLNGSLQSVQEKVATVGQSISISDETQLITFYSQVVNLQTALKNHTMPSQLFSWLENNTEQNVAYSQFSFSSGDQITLSASARSAADIAEQIAIFQASPFVQKVVVSNVGSSAVNGNGLLTFSLTLFINPTLILPSS